MTTPNLNHIVEQLRGLAVPVDSLNLDPENARVHPPENVAVTRGSLLRFGQYLPLVVQRKGMIVRVGNNRLTIARGLGWTHVAAIITDHPDDVARALAVVDNRSAELATWDDGALAKLLTDIKVDPALLEVSGFTGAEVKALLAPARDLHGDPNAVPDLPVTPITQEGDLWLLGEHRLLCGDSTREPDVTRVLDGARATCVFTDPPYGVSLVGKNRALDAIGRASSVRDHSKDIEDDDLKPEELKARLLPAFVLTRRLAMADDCTVFMTAPQGGQLGLMMMMMMMQEAGLIPRHVLIWAKDSPTFSIGRLDYDYQHEPILMTWLKRHKRPRGGAHHTSVWEIPKPRESADHPTQKPVELYVNAYLNHTDALDVVYEPYAGSGTAFIAATQTGRRCCGIELKPEYCDVIVRRWEALTGKKAERLPARNTPE